MAEQSILSRLGRQSGPMHELFESGWRFEGLRAAWFANCGRIEESKECLKRHRFFERELDRLMQEEKK
jgi:hypothetical protein